MHARTLQAFDGMVKFQFELVSVSVNQYESRLLQTQFFHFLSQSSQKVEEGRVKAGVNNVSLFFRPSGQ